MQSLQLGSKGSEVLQLTSKLKEFGFLDKVTDDFDKIVRQAVKQFQAAHTDSRDRPLTIDGAVGPLTWWALSNPDLSKHDLPTSLTDAVKTQGFLDAKTLGEEAINVALGEMSLGAQEIGANNSGPWVEKYLRGIVEPPANWCAAFVSYCYSQASKKMGVDMPFRYSLGAKNIHQQFAKKGWAYKATDENPPKAGDIIVWSRGNPNSWEGHIGLCYDYSSGVLRTIEGNKGSFPAKVRVFSYTLGSIEKLYGFGRVSV